MRQVTIEVYAFDGARWMLQQTYPDRQKDQALEFAHQLYAQSHIKGVRVMQETHDSDTGESTEKSLLKRTKSDDVPKSLAKEIKVKPAAPPPKASAKAAAKKAYPVASKTVAGAPGAPASPRPAAAPTIRRSRGKNFKRMAGGAAGAVAGSAVLAAGGGLLVSQMPADAHLVMGLRAALGPNFVLIGSAALVGLAVLTSAFVLFAALTEKDLLQTTLPVRAAGPVTVAFPKIDVVDDDDIDIIDIKSTPPPGKKASDTAADAAPDKKGLVDAPTENDAAVNVDATAVVGCFHKSLSGLKHDGVYMKDGRLDSYNWFGCHLFLAGLVDGEGKRRNWDRGFRRRVITMALTAVLKDVAVATRFAARYEEYLTEPRYLAMVQAGADANEQFAAMAPDAPAALAAALEAWNTRNEPPPATGHVVVMFTDIIGSTEFTQTHGDAKQYEMVQAHNNVVREALRLFSGREIKHTGDGIMAAFDDAALAVHATLQIQREIKAHREVQPDIGMTLRIGLAAGEPIKEGSDLFGSTVQLAARVCALAQADQILVADMVRQIAEPTGLTFEPLGDQTLKGFKQPVPVHRVVVPA